FTLALCLAQYQFTYLAYSLTGIIGAVERRIQCYGQAAASGTLATGMGLQRTIQIQAAAGGQRDTAAVAGNSRCTLASDIQFGAGARGIQQGTVAHHHKQIGGAGLAGSVIELATDHDIAAVVYLAITLPPSVLPGNSTARHIQHSICANPDGTAMASTFDGFTGKGNRHTTKRDCATPSIERAVHGQLANTAQVDGLAGVNIQDCGLA